MRIYLDTSVLSAYYDQRAPERMQATREFWGVLKRHDILCSDLTLDELAQASSEFRDQLYGLASGFRIIAINDEIRTLARAYLDAGIVPERYISDALHIAAAVYGDADILVSWNFKHLVKRNTRLMVNSVSAQRGLRSIEILAPPEL